MPRVTNGAEVGVYSFGTKNSERPPSTYIIDVTGLRDPLSNRGFRFRLPDGRAGEVQEFVAEDPRIDAILNNVRMLAHMYLRSESKGDGWLSFAFKDYHGLWIAPAVCELAADDLSNAGYKVSVYHYNIPRGGLG